MVVVAPHPDDESLGCGGLIAEAVQDDIAVRVIIVSDGIGSHPNSLEYPAPRLKALRETETLQAVAELGLAPEMVTFLELPDRRVPDLGPSADHAAERIAAVARAIRAGVLLVTWQHDPHCDHQAAFAITRAAAGLLKDVRLLAYPIWGWTLPADLDVGDAPPIGARFDTKRHAAAKRAAILAHRSQTTLMIDDDPDGFVMEAAMIDRFVTMPEIYLEQVP